MYGSNIDYNDVAYRTGHIADVAIKYHKKLH